MPPRICTACPTPHITTDYYRRRGFVICAPVFEDMVRRETRERYSDELNSDNMGYAHSIARRHAFQRVGTTTRDDQ